ncbi:YebW family protein [Ewingella sp. S1.OA.A_B6]
MFALVLTICYLGGGCEDLAIDAFDTKQQCMVAMRQDGLRHAGCYPIEDFIEGYWSPAQENADF